MKTPPEQAILAAGIEHDWSDVFFPQSSRPPERFLRSSHHSPPLRIQSPFPAEAAATVLGWLEGEAKEPDSVLEVGAGCGRFLRELLRERSHFRRAMACEPMAAKADFLRWIFGPSGPDREIPCRDHLARIHRFTVSHPGASRSGAPPVEVRAATLEELAPEVERNGTPFGLVACLNVIDHVPEPHTFPNLLARVTQPQGYLAISSPLDWHEEFTPRRHWRNDLSAFFRDSPTWEILHGISVPFIFRPAYRTLVVFQSKILLLRRRED